MVTRSPKTRRGRTILRIHQHRIPDPYQWLADAGKQDEINEWVKVQQAHTKELLSGCVSRQLIKARLGELFAGGKITAPKYYNGLYFYERRKAHEDLPALYVRRGLKGRPRKLVDPNTLSRDKTKVLASWSVSPDGAYVAYRLSNASNDRAELRVLEVRTKKNLTDVVPASLYPAFYSGIEWSSDSGGFWYARRPVDAPKGIHAVKFYQKLYFHTLGQDYHADTLVYDALAKEDWVMTDASSDGRYLLLTVGVASEKEDRTELYLYDMHHKEKGFVPVVQQVTGYFIGFLHGGMIYIMTNFRALRWKLMRIAIKNAHLGIAGWKTVIPASLHSMGQVAIIGDNLFVETIEHVQSVLKRYTLAGRYKSDIPLPEQGSIDGLGWNPEATELIIRFSSYLVPPAIYWLNLETNTLKMLKTVHPGFDTTQFKLKQVWCSSQDGRRIPMYLVRKRGLKLDGNNPVLLYGYGGFGCSELPRFKESIVPFLEAGGMYAVANIRGGGEFGTRWHTDGIRHNKQKSFDDFIAAAEWLVSKGYTSPERLAVCGWSNGGLLVGVAITQRPDLFRAAVIGAPVQDMLRFHQYYGGRHWISDYGDPDDPTMFEFLRQYSPYHNVVDGERYPACLILTADSDDRVHKMHAFKMAARLQKASSSGLPIMLLQQRKTGHSGATSIPRFIEQETDILSFIFDQLKMEY